MAIIKTARAIIDVLDGAGKITGHEIEYHVIYEGEDSHLFPPRLVREPATLEQVQAYRDASGDALTAELAALSKQLGDERAAHADVVAAKDADIAAKDAALVAAAEERPQ